MIKSNNPISISVKNREEPFYYSKEYLDVLRKIFWLKVSGEVIFTTYEEETKKYSTDSFRPAVVVSDVFWYACSDAEDLRYDDIEKVVWAKEQLKVYGVIIWASSKRKLFPKGKIFRYTKDKTDFASELISYKKKFPDTDLSFLAKEKEEFKDTNPSVVNDLYSLVAQDQQADFLSFVKEADISYSTDGGESTKEEILFLSTLALLEARDLLNVWDKEDYITSFSVEGLYENIDFWSYKDQMSNLKELFTDKEIAENKILKLFAIYGIPAIYAWLTANNKTKQEIVLDNLYNQLQYEAAIKFIENSYEAVSRSDTDE